MRSLIGLSFAAFSLAAAAAPASAQTDAQNARCANEDPKLNLSDTEVIAACTLIIDLKPKDVLVYALAYSNRAVAEDSLGQEDKANADLREAHRIDPHDFHAASTN
jgi:hypothetical protein